MQMPRDRIQKRKKKAFGKFLNGMPLSTNDTEKTLHLTKWLENEKSWIWALS